MQKKGEIYFYKNKLWAKQKTNPNIIESVKEKGENINSELDYLIYCHKHCSTFFYFAFDRKYYGIDGENCQASAGGAKGADLAKPN